VHASDEDAFMRACAEAPTDRTVRLVYADWLEERGDDRARYLRLEQEVYARHHGMENTSGLDAEFAALAAGLKPEWMDLVGLKCDLLLQSFRDTCKISVIKAVREVTGLGLRETVDLVQSAPSVILRHVSILRAIQGKASLEVPHAWDGIPIATGIIALPENQP
jgi:uncharacterized protein (TIGR02996 family)